LLRQQQIEKAKREIKIMPPKVALEIIVF